MTIQSKRSEPSTTIQAPPDAGAGTPPLHDTEVKWVRRFPLRLKAYTKWMTNFLHGHK